VHRDVAGVATDSEDRVYLICRGDHPIIVYDTNGKFLRSWGQGEFTYRTHGITVGPDEMLYCTDDGNHTVRKFTPDGKLLMTMGTMNKPSDTGLQRQGYGTVSRAGGPFNRPTNLAVGPKGDLYVSDGYGNCRVHQYSPSGELKRSWGTPGGGPGEFFPALTAFSVAADGRVFVCDRGERSHPDLQPGRRVSQRVDRYPAADPPRLRRRQGRAYVSELWWHKGQISQRNGPTLESKYGRVSVFDRRPGPRPVGHAQRRGAGKLRGAHGLAVDSRGAIYVAEVTHTSR